MAIIEELLKVFKIAADKDRDWKRPINLETVRGEYIYSDHDSKYAPLIPELKRSISSVESLSGAVLEEAKRRENQTGKFMTVIFNEKGGVFYPDDKARLDLWTYERRLSQQWEFLLCKIDREVEHLEFLRILQGLRPSINNYPAIIREFRKVTFDGKTSVTSQPIIEQGVAGTQVNFTLETKNGVTETAMPGEFVLLLPFTRGGSQLYTVELSLDVALVDNRVKFRLVWPEREVVTEQAIQNEVNLFKTEVESLSELLILLDY